ncbi:unnamed protein product [Adineta steineri]|uniref:RanBP2-type domain-containing protein n=1 Tax=Adineta steineri TaxID=433720 RepID=A0A813Q3D1_9BILA|nr:unnamed protein product [Adineta steineri]
MGNKQGTTSSWSVDDWAYGTGENAVPVEEVVDEVKKIPKKYFGGQAIENDASMHQMQNDLLSFDDTLKRIFFRRKKNKRSRKDEQQQPEEEEYYYEEEEEQRVDGAENPEYLEPIYVTRGDLSSMPTTDSSDYTTTTNKSVIWRCSHCTQENKVSENSCRRCGQAESKF